MPASSAQSTGNVFDPDWETPPPPAAGGPQSEDSGGPGGSAGTGGGDGSPVALSIAGDTVVLDDFSFFATFGDPAARAAAFAAIMAEHDGGATHVEWTEGDTLNVSERVGDTLVVTSTDGGSQSWDTSVTTFDAATGDRLSKVTTFDDGTVQTREYESDALVRQVTSGLPDDRESVTLDYDSAGRVDSQTILYDAGNSIVYTYDDAGATTSIRRTDTAGRTDSLVTIEADGFRITTTYDDAGQRTTLAYDDTVSDREAWTRATLVFDPATGLLTQKTTVFDNGNAAVETYSGGVIVSRVTVDSNDDEVFSSVTQTYDAGRFAGQVTQYDDGSSLRYTIDADGFTTTTAYDTAGQMKFQIFDDTASDRHGWTTSTLRFDPATGQLATKTTVLDEGNTLTDTYEAGVIVSRLTEDTDNDDSYATILQTFVGGVFSTQAIAWDNGSGIVVGSANDDRVVGTPGVRDVMSGYAGTDTFVFVVGGGVDRAADFVQGVDLLDLTAFGIDAVADIDPGDTSQLGTDLLIDLGGGDLARISNVSLATLTDADFV